MLFGFLFPILKKEWNLNEYEIALLSSSYFLGWSLGSLICGWITDSFGRLLPI